MSRLPPPWKRWWLRRLSPGEKAIIACTLLALGAIINPSGAQRALQSGTDGLQAMAADLERAPVARVLPDRGRDGPPSSDRLIAGRAEVVDGDTLDLGQERIRLQGIDAFERSQTCSGRPCGEAGRQALQRLVAGRQVTCAPMDTDRYRRTVARCSAGGRDLGAEMVRSGHALAYEQYSREYVDEERDARADSAGAWAYGDFIDPADYRRGR